MSKLYDQVIEVCDHCLESHMRYSKHLPFDRVGKVAVSMCRCCKKMLCQRCYEHSLRELGPTSILAKYDFAICRSCITTKRRVAAMKPRLERAVREAVENVKVQMELNIYLIMQEQGTLQ